VVQQIPVGNGPSGIAIGYGSVWVTNSSDGTLSRINATTGAAQPAIPLGSGATDVAVGLGAVWVSDEASGRVLRVEPQTDQLTEPINVGNGPTAITVGYGSVWVTNSLDGTVSRIDPRTDSVAQVIGVGQGPNAIAAGSGAVWVANEFAGSVSRIDPATNHTRPIRIGNRPQGIAVAGGLVWVGAQATDATHRGGTLAILKAGSLPLGGGNHESFGSFDPANAFPPLTLQLTNDGLTAFKRVGGSDGAQIVPDLAISLPTPTDGGLTYTFQLRRGIRYSNGQPVKPEDFRRAIERDFKIGDYTAPGFYANLVGGATCVAHPSRCDLSRGIVANDSAGTVTFHFATPDPELLYQLALWDAVAVPAGIANHDVGQHPIPATGPYEVANVTSKELRLLRNPYFHEWSRAARPDGYPDEIVIKVGASPSADLTAVEHGAEDLTLDTPPANRLIELETRFAAQLHMNPAGTVIPLWLNTRVAPFNDSRVRRALSYAIDRGKIAHLIGLDPQPTCQLLTPYIPGYKPYCPYTLDPSADKWSAPDMAAAERLIAASHTRGTPITVWNFIVNDFGNLTYVPVGRYIVSLLDRLGYPTREGKGGSMPMFADSRTKEQVALVGWTGDYPSASQYITAILSCENFTPNATTNLNPSEFCDPQLQHQIDSAEAAQKTNSPAVSTLWAHADRTATDDAPLVPLIIPRTIDFVSRRVGNYQYSPQLGGTALIDQLWVK
jgi:peptide/nickel transport system substrate-binding protein